MKIEIIVCILVSLHLFQNDETVSAELRKKIKTFMNSFLIMMVIAILLGSSSMEKRKYTLYYKYKFNS